MGTARIWIAFIILVVAVTASEASTLKWASCASGIPPVTVVGVEMTPDPAVSGEDFTIQLPATSATGFEGGTVTVFVLFHGIPIHYEKDDLCRKTDCPVPAGSFLFRNSQALPSITPAGQYTVRITATALDGQQLFCERISFSIVRSKQSRGFLAQAVEALAAMAKWRNVEATVRAAEQAWNLPGESLEQLRRNLNNATFMDNSIQELNLGRRGGFHRV